MSFKRWQVILVVLVALVAVLNARYWMPFVPGYSALREAFPYYIGQSYNSLIEVLVVLLLTFALLRNSERNVLETLGLADSPLRGIGAAAIMVLPLYLVFATTFSVAEFVPLEALYLAFVSPFAEELAFRGFAFGLLRKVAGWGFWPAALVPAAFFGWGHVDQASDPTGIVMTLALTGVGALLFAWLFEKWGGLWVPLGLHISMNFAWTLFAVGDGAYAGTLPTIMQVTTILTAILITVFRHKIAFLGKSTVDG